MNIIILGVTILILLAVAFFFHKSMRFTPEESIAAAIMSILVLIYITGLAGNTRVGLIFVYIVALLGVIQLIFNRRVIWIKERNNTLRREFFSPGIIIFLAVCIYAIVAFGGILLHNWDELAQWGKAANYMVDHNKLAYGSSFDGAEILISSTTFFHYFMAKLTSTVTGIIDESQYYVSNFILWFAAVLLPLSGCKWKDVKRVIIYSFVMFASMTLLFVQPYYNIYCDQACAMWAGGLIAWQLFGKKSKYAPILTLLILWNVSLFKSMVGPMFAVIAVIVIGINTYMNLGDSFKERVKIFRTTYKIKQYLYGALVFIMPFLATIIWSVFVKDNALIRGGVIKAQDNRIALTLMSGLQKIFVSVNLSDVFPRVSFFTFFVFAVIISFIICKYLLKDRMQQSCKAIFRLYCIGFGIYWLVLIYAYLTIFGYADSISTGSIDRYFSDYIMLGFVPLIFPFFMGERLGKVSHSTVKIRRYTVGFLVIFICITLNSGFVGRATTWYLWDNDTYLLREKFQVYKEKLLDVTHGNGKIYMINQDENGFPVVIGDYEMGTQLKRDGMPYYFQDSSEPKDIAGLHETSISNFAEILESENYEYLWIYKTDDYFSKYLETNYYLDRVKNGNVYKIIRLREGKYKLQFIENIKNT